MTQELRHSNGNTRTRGAIAWIGSRQLTSRSSATGISHSTGSRGQGKQYYPPAEIIRMPSGSITPLEPLDLSQARFNRALMFALPVSFILWGLIGLAIWGLISVFF
jgi:hypothetical protein